VPINQDHPSHELSLFPDQEKQPQTTPKDVEKQSVETDVTRVVSSGLVMRPIYELDSRRMLNQEENQHLAWEHLDIIWLAFALLDVVSEMTEYASGVSRKDVIARLERLALEQANSMQVNMGRQAVVDVLHKIFDHLVNRENRYLPFEYRYFDAGQKKMKTKKFWLIKTIYTGEGRTALYRLTDEGYTAYFGLYETGALDAAAIGNLRIKLLIDRGQVDDAIGVAKQNQKQCLRKSHELKALSRSIERHINRVDAKAANILADEGAMQTRQIQEESGRLHHLVRQKLASDLGDSDRQYKLRILGENLEKLNYRLLELSGELQELPEVYDRNSHKLFRRPPPGIFPSCEQILNRLKSMDQESATGLGREFLARFDPPVIHPLFDPASVMEACDRALERQTRPQIHTPAIQEIEKQPVASFESQLPPQIMDQAFHFLVKRVHSNREMKLSRILHEACRGEQVLHFPVAVAMAVFHCMVDPFHSNKWQIRVILSTPETLFSLILPDDRRYWGHELLLTTKNPRKEAPDDPSDKENSYHDH